jgi:hemerythrin-like domain-containing protein
MVKAENPAASASPAPAMRHPGPLPAPPAFVLLDQPLDYLLAEHLRHRVYGAMLGYLAQTRQASRTDADRIITFLTADLDLHHADEDEDLFPALRRRALPEDDLGAVLARLGEDHSRLSAMAEDIVAALSRHPASETVRIDQATSETMQAYAASEARHLAIENAVVLTIAGVRLSKNDLKSMSRSMKARRGVRG